MVSATRDHMQSGLACRASVGVEAAARIGDAYPSCCDGSGRSISAAAQTAGPNGRPPPCESECSIVCWIPIQAIASSRPITIAQPPRISHAFLAILPAGALDAPSGYTRSTGPTHPAIFLATSQIGGRCRRVPARNVTAATSVWGRSKLAAPRSNLAESAASVADNLSPARRARRL